MNSTHRTQHKRKASRQKRRVDKEPKALKERGIAISSLHGAAFSLALVPPLSLLCAAICLISSRGEALLHPLSALSCAVVYFLGGFDSSRHSASPLICGLLCSALISIAFLIICAVTPSALSSAGTVGSAIIKRILLCGICAFGAVIGARKKRRPRNRR